MSCFNSIHNTVTLKPYFSWLNVQNNCEEMCKNQLDILIKRRYKNKTGQKKCSFLRNPARFVHIGPMRQNVCMNLNWVGLCAGLTMAQARAPLVGDPWPSLPFYSLHVKRGGGRWGRSDWWDIYWGRGWTVVRCDITHVYRVQLRLRSMVNHLLSHVFGSYNSVCISLCSFMRYPVSDKQPQTTTLLHTMASSHWSMTLSTLNQWEMWVFYWFIVLIGILFSRLI